jgi:hypothetical protein
VSGTQQTKKHTFLRLGAPLLRPDQVSVNKSKTVRDRQSWSQGHNPQGQEQGQGLDPQRQGHGRGLDYHVKARAEDRILIAKQ